MAQVGRISGPLLYANLERNGIDLAFRNDLSTTQLLYLDVNTGKIGVNTDTPTKELDVLGTTRTPYLISGPATTPSYNISGSTFNAFSGDILLDAAEAVVMTTLDNGTITINDNNISTTISNADIDITPHGTGRVDVKSNLNVDGNIDATGNITFDGSITFGDDSTVDTITFESDINSDINPDADALFDLGSNTRRWDNAHIERLNGELIITDTVLAGGVSYNLRHGNQFYVAVNGNDSNTGDHILAPLASIKEALARADASTAGPVSIYVAPGDYQEDLPLVVPPDVSIVGEDVRNVIVRPTTAYQSEDVFHLNGETTISNLTIKEFFYDSINDKGYAFRFAPGGVISTRSPYVQNCTVITQGSTTSASDPRGFDEGDAGKGALVDGAELDSASVDASMLFHSITFITPGVDAITMTNGVRVEWLNSFTYFANRGLYAVNGATGRTSPDGSTVIYGAEIRSIGSASVYGNYGAVADGADTLMYLIQHNLAYIGTGKDKENDVSLVNQDNEIVELNSGRIQFVTTDHTGAFRVGDNFFVDFETGSTTLNADDISADAITNIEIVDGSDKTIIDVSKVQTGNVRFFANTVGSTTGNLNFTPAADINITADTSIAQDLDITGNLSFDGSLNLLGNQPTDLIEFNVNLDQNFNPHSDSNFNLGSATKQWSNIWLSEIDVDNVSVFDNVITTKDSNSNLELRAAGTGNILVPNTATFSNDLTVNGTSTLSTVNINGDLNPTNVSVPNPTTLNTTAAIIDQDIDITQSAQFEEILFDDNFITTTNTNANLELRASGTGNILIPNNDVQLNSNLSADDITSNNNITITTTVDFGTADVSSINIQGNYFSSNTLNANLELRASGTGIIDISLNDVLLNESLTISGITDTQSISVNGLLTQIGNRIQTGNFEIAGEITNGNILIEDNFITTTNSNSDLEIRASGTGEVLIPNNNLQVNNNLTVSTDTNLQGTIITGSLTHVGDTTHTGNITQGGELTVDNVYIEDNFITTTTGNLILSATGNINVDTNDVEITQDLTVSGLTSLQGTTITGNLTHAGNRTQTGNLEIAGEITNSNILIEDNFISATETNSDLELRASGTGEVVIDPSDTLTIDNNLFVEGTLTYQGTLTINGNLTLQGNVQDGSLTVTENFTVEGDLSVDSQAQFEDIRIEDNFITTTASNSNLELRASGTGNVVFDENVIVDGNLFTASITTGDINIDADLILDEIVIPPSIIEIDDNFISTKISNADLDLRANGTGNVIIESNDVNMSQDLTVNGETIINNNVSITGTLTQTGNYSISNNLSVIDFVVDGNLTVDARAVYEKIILDGNLISSSEDLELRAAGTGNILVPNNDVVIEGDLTAESLNDIETIIVQNEIELDTIELSTDIQLFENVITTTNSNSNLELKTSGTGSVYTQNLEFSNDSISTRALLDSTTPDITFVPGGDFIFNSTGALKLPSGTTAQRVNGQGDLRFNTDENVFEGYNTSTITLGGVYSEDRKTTISAHPVNNTISFIADETEVASLDVASLYVNGFQTSNILIDNTSIGTNVSNADLDIRTDGIGILKIEGLELKGSTITNITADEPIQFAGTGQQWIEFEGNSAVKFPAGTTAQRPASPVLGQTRVNTDNGELETWIGTEWRTSAGEFASISEAQMEEEAFIQTLIYG